jgi:hypothetical protein
MDNPEIRRGRFFKMDSQKMIPIGLDLIGSDSPKIHSQPTQLFVHSIVYDQPQPHPPKSTEPARSDEELHQQLTLKFLQDHVLLYSTISTIYSASSSISAPSSTNSSAIACVNSVFSPITSALFAGNRAIFAVSTAPPSPPLL